GRSRALLYFGSRDRLFEGGPKLRDTIHPYFEPRGRLMAPEPLQAVPRTGERVIEPDALRPPNGAAAGAAVETDDDDWSMVSVRQTARDDADDPRVPPLPTDDDGRALGPPGAFDFGDGFGDHRFLNLAALLGQRVDGRRDLERGLVRATKKELERE